MIRIKLLIVALAILFTQYSLSQTTPEQMVLKMGRGINLGNVLSAPFEGDWAPPVQETYFEDVANVGFENVRIPIRFDNQTTTLSSVNYTNGNGDYVGSPSDYTVNSTYLDRIEEVVGWALDKNLVAIIDVHGDHWFWESFDSGSPEYKTGNDRLAAIDRFKAIWTAISIRFQNTSEDLLFEIMNEAYFSMSTTEVDDINTSILSIIRLTNPTRNVIVNGGGSSSWEAPLQMSSTFINSDSYLIATFHYYRPFNFTASSRQEFNIFDWGTASDKATIDSNFDAVQSWSQNNGIPIYLGEFGADNEGGYNYDTQTYGLYGGPTNASRIAYHNYLARAAVDRGFCFAVWDAGHKSNKTVYNVSNRSWVVDIRNAVLDVNCISSQIIFNADIECGYNSEWSLFSQAPAVAIFSNAEPENSRASSTTIKVDVTNQGTAFNTIILSNQVLDASNYLGETLRISCYAKASTTTQDFKFRVKAVVDGSNNFSSSPVLSLSNLEFEGFEYFYDVPLSATTLQVQVLVGDQAGAYYFDDFFVDGNSTINTNSTNWYVSMSGDDNNNGISPTTPFRTFSEVQNNAQPGDTIFVMGTYTNDSYNSSYSYTGNINDPHIWHGENSVRINNLNGTATKYITIKPYDVATVIKGDGNNIFRVTNSSYLRVEGIELYGEVENIPLSTSKDLQFIYRENGTSVSLRRVPEGTTDAQVLEFYSETGSLPALNNAIRPSYVDTRGFYFSNVHHIDLINNKIHHTPGNGFRVADCDYINIIGNEVYATSRKSYTGTHGLVVTNADSQIQGFSDTNDDYKIFILNNLVYENYNEIYSWAPTKTFINPVIDEGKGISLQRNDIDNNGTPGDPTDDSGWLHGRILVANNITYKNGFSGLHSNSGTRIDFINNTSYLNSFTKSVYVPTTGNGGNIGISSQNGIDIKMINNISVIDKNLNKSAIATSNSTGLVIDSNIIYGTTFDTGNPGAIQEDAEVVSVQTNTLMVDPLFVDPLNNNFSLQSGSPARDIANTGFAPTDDFFGNLRDANPDLGAIEYSFEPGIVYIFDGAWTPENPSGVSTDADTINVISGIANSNGDIISADTQANTLNITSGAKLVINTNGALTVENFDNQGTLTIRSNSIRYGTFITNNIITNGTVDYRRYVNPNDIEAGNDLISAPLHGETFEDFVNYQTNDDVIFFNPNNSSQKLFGPYDKVTNSYLIYDTDNTGDASATLDAGIGYRTGSVQGSSNTFVFSGNLETGEVNVPIVVMGDSFAEWNLIGNPYTANLDFEAFFDANKNQLNTEAYRAIYGYNATFDNWTIWNQISIDNPNVTELIVPGQAFFVASKPDNGIITFTPEMRRTGISDDFILNRSAQNTFNELRAKITLNANEEVFSTDIYFIEGQTRDLNIGYDAGAYNGEADGIFTHLVENNDGIEMAIQTLPFLDVNDVTIPLGIKASQGTQISIGLDDITSTINASNNVYLEDTLTNTWTLLNDFDYTLNLTNTINSTGRFFLHFQSNSLSETESDINSVNIYVVDNEMYINGFMKVSTQIEVYDILGRFTMSSELTENINQNVVSLQNLSSGVYIVRLNNKAMSKVQKIVIK